MQHQNVRFSLLDFFLLLLLLCSDSSFLLNRDYLSVLQHFKALNLVFDFIGVHSKKIDLHLKRELEFGLLNKGRIINFSGAL